MILLKATAILTFPSKELIFIGVGSLSCYVHTYLPIMYLLYLITGAESHSAELSDCCKVWFSPSTAGDSSTGWPTRSWKIITLALSDWQNVAFGSEKFW